MQRLFSFDIFDTVITRRFASPRDLFLVLASRVLGAAPIEEQRDFAGERVAAEIRARAAKGPRDDIALADIYREFEKSPFGRYAGTAMAAEVAVELESVVAIRSGVEAVRERQRSGERVVFLSDMYLAGDVLARMLRLAGIDVDENAIYVSGEVGYSKYTGRLFDHVAACEAVQPRNCLHVGDHWKRDVLRPRLRGWKARLFSAGAPNRYEKAAASLPWGWRQAGGVARAVRLRSGSGDHAAAAMAANVVGPLLTSFVARAISRAEAAGHDTLYFTSTSGKACFGIAKALQAEGLGADLECRYLHLAGRGDTHGEWVASRPLPATSREYLSANGLLDPGRQFTLICDGPSSAVQEVYDLLSMHKRGDEFSVHCLWSDGECAGIEGSVGEPLGIAAARGRALSRPVQRLLETLAGLLDHPVVGHEGAPHDPSPVFDQAEGEPAVAAFAANLHQELVFYARLARQVLGDELTSRAFIERSIANVRMFASFPTGREARSVGWLPCRGEAGVVQPLARPLTWRDVWSIVRRDRNPERNGAVDTGLWGPGAAALSPASVRVAYKLLRVLLRAGGEAHRQ